MIKTKKKFSERWLTQFAKRFNGIRTLLSAHFISHDEVNEKFEKFTMETYEYLFSIAMAAKVTPKQMAKFVDDGDKHFDYVGKLFEEISKRAEGVKEKVAKVAKKAVKKATKKTTKKAK